MSTEKIDVDNKLRHAATILCQKTLKGLSKVGLKRCAAKIDGDWKKITQYDMNKFGT